MFKNEKNQISGFNVDEYLKVFPGSATQYLDWKVQQLWFYKVYPEGAIITDEPQPDAFKTPDTWVATTRVYLTREDRIDNLPAIQRSAKRGPKDNPETEEVMDTYTLSIIASIASALTALGFGPALLTNAEKEALSEKLLGIPQETQLTTSTTSEEVNVPVNASNTAVAAEPVVTQQPTVEAPVTAAPTARRGRPSKAEIAAREAAKQTATETVVNEQPVAESVKANNSESMFSSLEEAKAVVCDYHNYSGITMGEIWDRRNEEKRYQAFIDWCESSDRAPSKCPKEYAALKYIKENS